MAIGPAVTSFFSNPICSLVSKTYSSIVDAVDGLFSQLEKYSFGSEGVVAKFSVPVIKESLAKGLNAGMSSNPIAKTRNAVVGAMRAVISSYEKEELTVADLIALELGRVLSGVNLLADGKQVSVTYYEVDACGLLVNASEEYDEDKNVTSLMWTIPLGTLS